MATASGEVLRRLSWSLTVWLVILAVVALVALFTVSPEPAEPASTGGDDPPKGDAG